MAEVETIWEFFVSDPVLVDLDVFRLWLRGHTGMFSKCRKTSRAQRELIGSYLQLCLRPQSAFKYRIQKRIFKNWFGILLNASLFSSTMFFLQMFNPHMGRMITQDTQDQFNMFAQLENFLQHPVRQHIFQLSEEVLLFEIVPCF